MLLCSSRSCSRLANRRSSLGHVTRCRVVIGHLARWWKAAEVTDSMRLWPRLREVSPLSPSKFASTSREMALWLRLRLRSCDSPYSVLFPAIVRFVFREISAQASLHLISIIGT